ncbi:uncharacterized protein N7529_010828 [Penicillium soppii]|uniref:uncharacterized protein n=1 Tax=Penicillium soppii TaxID=69789 RepID=UPI0025489E00|nr:uncharacterized protein N7529_010828 [Penicillium soppii]KAJ5851443.1 hypothetical protein N7529_010828 [Penicillium soppii]
MQSHLVTQERANISIVTGPSNPLRLRHRRKAKFVRSWRPLSRLGANSRSTLVVGENRFGLDQ